MSAPSTLRVLLVEDNDGDARLLQEIARDLSRTELVLDRVFTLGEAAASLGGSEYEVLLVDLNLPDSSGLDTVSRILDAGPGAPVVVLTGQDDGEMATEAVRLGADDYLAKDRLNAPDLERCLRYSRERWEFRSAVERSQARARKLFEDAPVGMKVVDADYRVVRINDTACRMLGYDREELIGNSMLDHVHPDDRERSREQVESLLSGQETKVEVSKQFVRRDGEVRWGHVTTTLLERRAEGEEGEAGPHLQAVVQDVTRRREAEEKRRKSERRYRDLFESSKDPITMGDRQGRLVDVNPATADLIGWSRDELIGTKVENAFFDPSEYEQMAERVVEEGSVKDYAIRLRTRDGHPVECLISATLRRDAEGEVLGHQCIIRDVSEEKRLERELEHRALHDPLTGLPNRALFQDRLEQAMARVERVEEAAALLHVDLDRFKQVNDSLGHPAGDRLLKRLAERLRGLFRHQDTVARVGGDEFVVLLEDLVAPDEAEGAAERLVAALEAPFRLAGEKVPITASVGMVGHGFPGEERQEDGPDGRELLRRADRAMHRAKGRGGTEFAVYDPEVDVGEGNMLRRERELRQAVANAEFVPYYQPVVSLENGSVRGMELLARWNHPERGLLRPDEFISPAEDTGLIVPMGEQLLEQGLRDLARWDRGRNGGFPLVLHFNLSSRQFDDPAVVPTLSRLLDAARIPPQRLEVEVTESEVMRRPDRVEEVRDLGVSVAVDDFGTGYSSLAYLRRLAVDTLKVDMSFVHLLGGDPRDEAIVETVVSLGRTLDLNVIAEGIEEKSQEEILRRLGCQMGQGYLYARPAPAEEMGRFLTASSSVA